MLKHSFFYFLTICLLTVFFTLVLWLVRPIIDEEIQVVSPVPSFLNMISNPQVRLIDLWLPFFGKSEGSTETISLSASSALLFDLESNKVLFEKDAKKRLPMASLTKIMTAVVSLEHPRKDNKYVVSPAHIVGENSMGISPGEIFTQEELLYGLLLPSGNDAAEVLAGNFPGGGEGGRRAAFVASMNAKAEALGLKDTHFTNPSGLQGDGEQYTTAYDLLVITRYALEHFPMFREIVSTYEHTIQQTSTHKPFYLVNETNLLTSYPGVKGVKTGYTPEAGLCLVTYLDYAGHKIIGVLLRSENRRQEMKDLLDYSLKNVGATPPRHD